jgi:hypothetical protein
MDEACMRARRAQSHPPPGWGSAVGVPCGPLPTQAEGVTMHGLPVLIWLPVRMGTECTADAGGVSVTMTLLQIGWRVRSSTQCCRTCKGRCGSMLATTIMLEMREY